MKYIVVEIQKFENGNVAESTTVHPTRENAEQKYHEILMYAATSTLSAHSAVMLDELGSRIKSETYRHDAVAEEAS